MSALASLGPFVHYSAKPLGEITSCEQHPAEWLGHKPRGFWFCAGDGEDGWRAWCEGEKYNIDALACASEIEFRPDANILVVSGAAAIDRLASEYLYQRRLGRFSKNFINWPLVADRHDGIVIAPYCWRRRLSIETSWYYGWDCASGCVWNADAVATIKQRVNAEAA